MPFPYLLVILIYAAIGLLSAADASLVSLNLLGAFPALRWVRVHFITLGILSQAVFGLLPILTAALSKKPRPAMRWDIWLLLNAGMVTLIAGMAGMVQPIILAGGVMVFVAVILLIVQLANLRGAASSSQKFYLTGLGFLLVGIIIGTGLFLGWSGPLMIQIPLETHIHANTWGFMSLAFAGLLVDLAPSLMGRPLASSKVITFIFWAMAVGAFALVVAPWIGGNKPLTLFGIVLHIAATVTLTVALVRGFRAGGKLNSAGAWHLIGSYAWILAPVLVAPFIVLGALDGPSIEATAPQALVYGWMLQFGVALVPFIARKYFLRQDNPQLGGCKGTLIAMTLGSALVWASIFSGAAHGAVYAAGFALYLLAFARLLKELLEIAQEGMRASNAEI
ncbi:MAG TPA: hypothetical protein PLJ62_00165 [Thermoflexales bacterium]|nr:hypothetical protein [Thermoflexales bacterium]HQW35695.1 hypothetical protein [Thermoflexales bacterium]HQZ23292.1 hypothetical protein [Thermoflexales bacterium]HQZ98587.1 hypothetical protein [Thermoflexales bacterium]